jgi:hypothetical protein
MVIVCQFQSSTNLPIDVYLSKFEGLCFQGFVELFVILAKMNFPSNDLEISLRSLIYHCIYFLKIDGFHATDNCVTSHNGPVKKVSENVISKIEHINEMRRLEAKLNTNYQYIGVLSTNKIVAMKQKYTLRQLENLKGNEMKTKRSLFPIYFENI